MPRRRINQRNLSRFMDRKLPFEDLPLKTMKVTIYALRWVFLLIFLLITMGILALFLTGGEDYIQMILGWSLAGFFTFFMGYFGWILAQGMIEMITGGKKEKAEHGLFYFKKNRRYKA